MKFSVVTPTGSVVSTEAYEVTVPGALGEFCILPDHRPAVLMIGGGKLSYAGQGTSASVFVKGGIVEIGTEHVTVLTDVAIREGDLDNIPAPENFDDVEYMTEEHAMRKRFDDNFQAALAAR